MPRHVLVKQRDGREAGVPPILHASLRPLPSPARRSGSPPGERGPFWNLSSPGRGRIAGWKTHPARTHSKCSRGLSQPLGIHLNFALGLSNEVGPPQTPPPARRRNLDRRRLQKQYRDPGEGCKTSDSPPACRCNENSGNRYCPGYGPPASSRDSSSSRRSRSRTTRKTPAVDPHLVPLGRAGCRSQAWLRRRVTARTKAFESPPVESDGLHLRIPPPKDPDQRIPHYRAGNGRFQSPHAGVAQEMARLRVADSWGRAHGSSPPRRLPWQGRAGLGSSRSNGEPKLPP